MKRLILFLLIGNISSSAHSQTWDEWFRQKETQKKYFLEQIATLRVYFGYIKEGYSIASKGLNTINDIKHGDFNLHNDKFKLLKIVNPLIKNYAKVGDIIAFQQRIIRSTKECMIAIKKLGQFTPPELNQCTLVFNNLLADCIKNISELIMLVTSGEIEMKDDERLSRIDALYADMQTKYGFCSSYTEEMTFLTLQRMRESHEINMSRKLNNLQ